MISRRLAIIAVFFMYFLGMYTGYYYHEAIEVKLQIESKQEQLNKINRELYNRRFNTVVNISDENLTAAIVYIPYVPSFP